MASSFVDGLVREYLLFRGFSHSLKVSGALSDLELYLSLTRSVT